MDKLGIRAERTNVYSPEMNGVSERLNRTLLDSVRTLLIATKLSGEWWAEILHTSVHLKNRVSHSGINNEVPDAMYYGRKPVISYLRRIGSLCFVHDERRPRSKLQPRSRLGILVGYAIKTSGYRVWFPDEGIVIRETRSVRFDEKRIGMDALQNAQKAPFVNFSLEDDPPSALGRQCAPTTTTQSGTHAITQPIVLQPQMQTPQVEPANGAEWEREVVIRKSGQEKGRPDIYYRYMGGPRQRSRKDVEDYCTKQGLAYEATKFDFSTKNVATTKETTIQSTSMDNPNPPIGVVAQEDTEEAEENSDTSYAEFHPEAFCAEIRIPTTYEEAISSPEAKQWKQAMTKEINILNKRKVYTTVPEPTQKKVIGSRWVYDVKRDVKGDIVRFRARLVAQGCAQRKGYDFFETYSPVIAFTLVRFFFTLLVVCCGWIHCHLDVNSAYLYGKLTEEVYVRPAPGYNMSDGVVWRLQRALYGLHQSGRSWFEELDSSFKALGFSKVLATNCVYTYKNKALILVYVDDLAIMAKDEETLRTVVELIAGIFEVKNLGPLNSFLGVQFEYAQGRWKLHQRNYIKNLARIFKLEDNRSARVPLEAGVSLTANRWVTDDKADATKYR